MRILVLSDSHNKKIEISFIGFDMIIHLGDYGLSYSELIKNNVYFVRGNCDDKGPKIIELLIGERKTLLTHGDNYDVKYDLNKLFYLGKEKAMDIIFYGHTHMQEFIDYDGIKLINPGAYQNKEYAIIENNTLYFYKDKIIVNRYELKWWNYDIRWFISIR